MFETWPESKWLMLNAVLRILLITMLVVLCLMVWKYGFSPCDKCQFCDNRVEGNKCITATQLIKNMINESQPKTPVSFPNYSDFKLSVNNN